MKFSFCVITGGDLASVNRLIDSIEVQNIPAEDYEIIVIGGDIGNLMERKNILHCCFDESEKANWITKKKMLAVEHASFENVVLTHDYIIFDAGWYEGWKAFGDDWDVAMNVIYNGDGERFRDWLALDPHATVPYNITGYHPTMYISGTYWLAKRQFMLDNSLDLNRGWCEAEDIEWSMRCRGHWNYKVNPNSSVRSSKVKETWQILDHNGVQNFIHYNHFIRILGKHGISVHDDNGILVSNGMRSIHYAEFDFLRQQLRELKPKNILVVGDPMGMASFASQWVAKEIGANVIALDYAGSWGLHVSKTLAAQFGWVTHTHHQTIESPTQIEHTTFDVDVVLLGGTYEADIKAIELAAAKKLVKNGTIFIFNTNSDGIREALPNGSQVGGFYKAGVTNG